jgi:hypothetical protein
MDPAEFEAFVWLIWTILCFVTSKNPVFNIVLGSQTVLEHLLLSSGVVFAPGLCAAILSLTPPSLEFWLNLPSDCLRIFGVYVLVLFKAGFPYKIYIGAGTESTEGVETRWDHYDRKQKLPTLVKEALEQGYSIEYKGLLCWAPLPPVGNMFRVRVLIYAMEATFTVIFWAIASRMKDKIGVEFCPWPLESMEYVGLCSHSAFFDGIKGAEDGLTVEEMEAKEIAYEAHRQSPEYVERVRVSTVQSKAHILDTQQYSCKLCGSDFISPSQLEIHEDSEKHKLAVLGVTRELKKPSHKEWEMENLRLRKFLCHICPNTKPFGTQTKLNTHYKTQKHKDAVSAASTS